MEKWSKVSGVLFDKKITFEKHIAGKSIQTEKILKILYPLINKRSKLSTKVNKLTIYKVIIVPMMLYGCKVWGHCAKTHIKKLQIRQNKCFKLIMKLPYDYSTRLLHEDTKINSIEDKIKTFSEIFYARCELSENSLINEITSNWE